MSVPQLVLVSGTHGAGKSTLARAIGDELGWPVVSRDAIGRGMRATRHLETDVIDTVFGREQVEAFFATLRTLLDHGVSVVADQPFRRGVSETDVAPLLALARAVIVHCTIPREIAIERCRARGTARIAAILESREESRWDRVEQPLELDVPVLSVKTVDGYSPELDVIADFCRSTSRSR